MEALPECTGNCEWRETWSSIVPVDDLNQCGCVPCANAEFCNSQGFMGDPKTCMGCGSWMKIGGKKWDVLEFRDTTSECSICFEATGREVKFPAESCQHWYCIRCSRKLLLWDETRHHLNRVPFGCPPCPNRCENPTRGRQCYCEEYDAIQENWERMRPEEFTAWNDAENNSMDCCEEEVYGSRKCPVCRRTFG